MKKINNFKKDTVLKIVLLVLIIVVYIMLMIQPERFSYPYAMKDVKVKKEAFESLNMQILQEQQMLTSKQSEYEMVEAELDMKQRNSEEVAKKLDMANLDLHIPSLLLVLEEKSVENNLNIHIKYDEKKIVSNDYDPMLGMEPNMETEMVDESIVIEYENMPENPVSGNTGDISTVPPIEGLNILVLPVEVEGDYESLRNFIKFLDTMDFIIPYSIKVETQGEYVIGELIVQIFYEGGN